jgi:hypothetical protein
MKEYSFLDTLLLINGVEISGFDEGDDTISLDRINDSASHKVGTDGEMTVAISADRSGTATFRLSQSSDSNSYMSGLINAQENGVFTPIFIQFKDTRGGDLGSGTQGYITRPASMTRGSGVNSQEWVVVVERLDLLHLGGL